MQTPTSKYYFLVESLEVSDGKKLKALTPDSDGYYNDVPLMALNKPTLNGTLYDAPSVIKCITATDSRFNIMLRSGTLIGEWDHPEYRDKSDLARLVDPRQEKQSHHFRKIYSSEPQSDGSVLILGSLKPCGPYGKYLEESLQDPHRNTAFSIRSLCEEKRDNRTNAVIRHIKLLVTFDAVSSPGFKEASKRYSPGTESLLEVTPDDFPRIYTPAGLESSILTDTEFKSVFGSLNLRISRRVEDITGTIREGSKYYVDASGEKRSLFHALVRS